MSAALGFAEAFDRPAAAMGEAPGRVNLIGEHTDYNGGAVLPAALTCTTRIALAPSDTPHLRIKSTRFDALTLRACGSAKQDDWTDYATGAIAKATELGWLKGGADLYIDSDVPDGAGVSSSAALITAILRGAAELASVSPDPVEVAQHARAVENDYIGMPCGIMDQMAIGLAAPGKALALDTRDLDYEILDIPLDWGFATLHSGIRRELADGRYKLRFEECQQASERLGTSTLCRLTSAQTQALHGLPSALLRRARHVTSEHSRTVQASAAMAIGDFETFANLMNESHRSYAQDFEASTPEIDALIEDARATGAPGARLTGGGFGGCIVVLHRAEQLDPWVDQFLARHPDVWRI